MPARNGTRDGGMPNVIADPKEAVCGNRNWIKMAQNFLFITNPDGQTTSLV